MYRRKTLRRSETQKQQLHDLSEILYEKAPGERLHAIKVQQHAERLASLLHLNDEEASKLKRAGFYHDIGKVVLEPQVITSKKTGLHWYKNATGNMSAPDIGSSTCLRRL